MMKTTSTVAVEFLLGLAALHVMTEVDAQAGLYRPICTQHWRPNFTNCGHTKTISGYGA
jgi:hypothetical protein